MQLTNLQATLTNFMPLLQFAKESPNKCIKKLISVDSLRVVKINYKKSNNI